MYLPKHFAASDAQARELLRGIRVADLVSHTDRGLFATFLPLIYDPGVGEQGVLLGHVARKNDHWRLGAIGEAMAIVHGPDAYISPNWYAAKREHGRVVPTWNYLTVHVYGELVIHDDPVWVEHFVRRLTALHEATEQHPWEVDDAPRDYIDAQLRAIVGIELRITRIEAKAKLGLNRSSEDVDGVISGLARRGDHADHALAQATDHARRN